jgi:hypothetical protein
VSHQDPSLKDFGDGIFTDTFAGQLQQYSLDRSKQKSRKITCGFLA